MLVLAPSPSALPAPRWPLTARGFFWHVRRRSERRREVHLKARLDRKRDAPTGAAMAPKRGVCAFVAIEAPKALRSQCRFAVGKCQCCQTATIRRPKHVAPPRKAAMLAGALTLRATTRSRRYRRRRQKVDPQNGRDFGEQDIPDRVAAGAADRAHHHGRDGRQPEFEGFFRSGHGEQRQTKSVHDVKRVQELPRPCGTRRMW